MSKEAERTSTLWTSVYRPESGIPDDVLANQNHQNAEIFNSKPDDEDLKAFKVPLNESVFAVSVG